MQREKEARSRQRKQEQAYREAQRGAYSRIYDCLLYTSRCV